MKPELESQFPILETLSESVEPLSRNHGPNMTKKEHVYAICYRPEVAGDVIADENVKTGAMPCYLIVSEKIKISHLRNAWTSVGPHEPKFRGRSKNV